MLEALIIKFFEFLFLIVLLYITVEDIRKTYADDKVLNFLLAFSLFILVIKSILLGDFSTFISNFFYGVLLLNLFYLLFSLGLVGDGDGFIVSSIVFVFGITSFLISIILSVIPHSIFVVSFLIYKKNKAFGTIMFFLTSVLSYLLFLRFGIIFSLMFVLALLIFISKYKNEYFLKEEVYGREILPLDVVVVDGKELVVLDKNYISYSKTLPKWIAILVPFSRIFNRIQFTGENFVMIKDIKKDEKYIRKVPIPFLPLLFFCALFSFVYTKEKLLNLLINSLYVLNLL